MRNLTWMMKAFVGGAALLAVVGCEKTEVSGPATVNVPVAVAAPVVTPKVEVATLPSVVPAPVAVMPTTVVSDDVPEQMTALLDAARDAIKQGELDRALKLARIATTRSPKRSAAWNTLGRVQLQRGRRQYAIDAFDKAVELNPSSSFAKNNLGLALIYDGQFAEAADVLKEATEGDHVEAYMWNNLGMACEHLDRLAEARDAYQMASDMKSGRAVESLTRLTGVKSVRVARVESDVDADEAH